MIKRLYSVILLMQELEHLSHSFYCYTSNYFRRAIVYSGISPITVNLSAKMMKTKVEIKEKEGNSKNTQGK